MVTTVKVVKAEVSQGNQLAVGVSNEALVSFFVIVFQSDIRLEIVRALAKREGAGLREIARQVGLSHKNLVKYLQTLEENGVLDTYSVGFRSKVYRLSPKYNFMRQYL